MDGGADGWGGRVRHQNMSLFQENQPSMMQEAQCSQPAAGWPAGPLRKCQPRDSVLVFVVRWLGTQR